MKQIALRGNLGKGKFALVDDEDYEYLNQFKWYAKEGRRTFYAHCFDRILKGNNKKVAMHRLLLGLTDPKILGDHINHNGLDNQKRNLRACNHKQNGSNRRSKKNGTSKYLGVYANKYNWVANMCIEGKRTYLGCFPFTPEGEILAALKYNEYALIHHKEFASINIIEK